MSCFVHVCALTFFGPRKHLEPHIRYLFMCYTRTTLVTGVDFGKMTIYQVFIGYTWGTPVTDKIAEA